VPNDSSAVTPKASIVIPAHNEEAVIGQLLERLLAGTSPGEFEILVLANGCTDDTVAVAQRYAPAVRVLDLPEPSKRLALKRSDTETDVFPRLYVDGDVDLGSADAGALVAALEAGALAASPVRDIPRKDASPIVRAFYDVWEELPNVREGSFGRGVVAVSKAGFERIRELPPMMNDDLAMTAAFSPTERVIVPEAHVRIWPPRTARDLVRRRIRVSTGNDQFDQAGPRSDALTTSRSDLLAIIKRRPALTPKVAVFIGVGLVSKVAARRRTRAGDFTTWLRDESSRTR
jgi:glycosyltransferase involved in cell wall biosynthesis